MKTTIQIFHKVLILFLTFTLVTCMNMRFIEKSIFKDKQGSSKYDFEINIKTGSSFDMIKIDGSSELIPNGAYLQVTSINDGVIITAPILRIKEKHLATYRKDSVVNIYTILPLFYDKPMETRNVRLEIISYEDKKKWPVKINSPAKDNLFQLKGLEYAATGIYDKLFDNLTAITEAHANIHGLTIAEIKSMKPSEMPDYLMPLLVSIDLLDSVLNKEQLIKTFGLNQEGSEEWKIFEAVLSQIGLAKRYDDIALSLKNESYLKDDFHFEPLIKMRGGPNASNFFSITNTSIGSIVPEFYPPKTPEDLDKCMKLAIRTKVYEDGKDDVYLKTAEALITIGSAIPTHLSYGFKATDFAIKLLKVRNTLMNSMLPSQISQIEGELYQNEFHEEGPKLSGLYRNIKITATNDGLNADDVNRIIEIIDPASYISGAIFHKSIMNAGTKYSGIMSEADLSKYVVNIFGEILKKGVVDDLQKIDGLINNSMENNQSNFNSKISNMLKNFKQYDPVSFGPFDITDEKWIDVKTINENVIKVNENSKTFEIIGLLNDCDVDPWLSFHIKSGKFPRSRQINYNVNRNDNYSLVLPIKVHPIKITAHLPEETVLSTMDGRCRNNAYHIEVEPGETKTFTVDVISAVDDRISAIAERGGMVEIVTNHGKSNYDYLTTKTTYTLEYTAPEDKNGFIDAIRIESLSVSGLREILNSPERSLIIVVNVKDTEEQYSCSDNTIDQLSLMRMVDDNPNYNGVISICYDEFLKKTHILPANIGIDYANADSTTINLFFSGSHKDLSADDFAGVNLSGLTINRAGVIFGGMMKVEGKIKAGQRNSSNRALIMMTLDEYVLFNETKRVRGPYGPEMVDVPKSRRSIFKQSVSRRHFGKSVVSITISKWSSPCHVIGYFHGQVENVHFSGAFKIKLPSDQTMFFNSHTMESCFSNILDQ